MLESDRVIESAADICIGKGDDLPMQQSPFFTPVLPTGVIFCPGIHETMAMPAA